jgi:hypothetical protein
MDYAAGSGKYLRRTRSVVRLLATLDQMHARPNTVARFFLRLAGRDHVPLQPVQNSSDEELKSHHGPWLKQHYDHPTWQVRHDFGVVG